MNIKLKAMLITVVGFFGVFGTLYAMTEFPLLILLAALGGVLYVLYRAVLNHLEEEQKRKQR